MEILAEKEKRTKTTSFERDRMKLDEKLRKLRDKRKEAYEERLILQQEIGKLNIEKAKLEAKFDNLKVQWGERGKEGEVSKKPPKDLEEFIKKPLNELRSIEKETIIKIQELGPINLKALEDFDAMKLEFDEFKEKVDKIVEERNSILQTMEKIEEKRQETFMHTMNEINKHFQKVYKELVNGEARIELEKPDDINSGLIIRAQPPGKKLLNIDHMSGGEKTLTAFTFLFALQRYKPMPFYILDEADAALDKANTKKVSKLLKSASEMAQFIVITHNDSLVRDADRVFGVTMEDGESKIMGIELPPETEKPPRKTKSSAPSMEAN